MATQVQEFQVFVGSPSDVADERAAVGRAVNSVNETLGKRFNMRLNYQGWEYVQPGYGRPQATINPLVDRCDLFIGILNRRWGTETGTHASGFTEEFQRAISRHTEEEPLKIGLFFREVEPALRADPGPELQKVLAFQEQIRQDHAALYKPYTDPAAFELNVTVFLTDFLSGQVEKETRPPQGSLSAPAVTSLSTSSRALTGADEATDAIDEGGPAQVGSVLSLWARTLLREEEDFAEVLKTANKDRLLSFGLAMNDKDQVLPTHLANRLYRIRETLELLPAERHLWLRSLSADAGRSSRDGWNRVIPGWYFFRTADDLGHELVTLATSDETYSTGALVLLRELKARPTTLWPADGPGDDQLATWLTLLRSTTSNAVEYLYEIGRRDEDQQISQLLLSRSAGEAWESELRAAINAIQGELGEAVMYLVARPYSLADWLVRAIFEALPKLTVQELLAIIESNHSRDDLRIAAYAQLVGRHDAPPDVGQKAASVLLERSNTSRDSLLSIELADDLADRHREWVFTGWQELLDKDSSTDTKDRVKGIVISAEALFEKVEPGWDGAGALVALSFKGSEDLEQLGRTLYVLVHETLTTGGSNFASPTDSPMPSVVEEWILSRARSAATKILVTLGSTEHRQEHLQLIWDEIQRDDLLFIHEAVIAYAILSGPTELSKLLDIAASRTLTALEIDVVCKSIYRAGGATAIVQVLGFGNSRVTTAAAALVVNDPDSTVELLNDLLYHKDDGVRREALTVLLRRLEESQLTTLLTDYPNQADQYVWYDVMSRLDWHLFANTRRSGQRALSS